MNLTKLDAKHLGVRIKKFRASVDLSQRDFAKICKVTQANVSQWESGKISPPLKLLQHIRTLYPKVNIEWFLRDSVVLGDPFHDDTKVKLEKQTNESSLLGKEVKRLTELALAQEKEIARLREQVDVLTIVARKRLLK